MPQDLNQVPPGAEVWEVEGTHFLIWYVEGSNPPIPLAWRVTSSADRRALGINTSRIDRKLSWAEFNQTGALRHGTTTELANTKVDPWEQIQSNFETEVRVKPWLEDPEILGLWYAAALEGRSITQAELQGTNWWRTHTQAERQWISMNASDPATAEQLIADRRSQVAQMFRDAGINNASQDLIDLVADNWTQGKWSEIYATNQIRRLADPNLTDIALDAELSDHADDLDQTRAGEDTVRDMIRTWLGPSGAQGWTDDHIQRWASRLREDPDARLELEEILSKHRLALFPEYENPALTYEDIAGPWRGVWEAQWGEIPDEADPLFTKIVRLNDRHAAETVLRTEGLERGNQTVSHNLISDLDAAFGGQVRRAHPAVQ